MMRRGYIQQAEGDIAKIEEGRMRGGTYGTDGTDGIRLRARRYGAISLRARRYGSTSSACARVLRRDEKGVSAEADRYDREEAGAEARHYERGGA